MNIDEKMRQEILDYVQNQLDKIDEEMYNLIYKPVATLSQMKDSRGERAELMGAKDALHSIIELPDNTFERIGSLVSMEVDNLKQELQDLSDGVPKFIPHNDEEVERSRFKITALTGSYGAYLGVLNKIYQVYDRYKDSSNDKTKEIIGGKRNG